MNTTSNKQYLQQLLKGGFDAANMDSVSQGSWYTLAEITDNWTDWDMLDADPTFGELANELVTTIKREYANPKKATRKLTASAKKKLSQAQQVAKKKFGRKATHQDDFAEQMRQARAAKRSAKSAQTNQSSASTENTSSGQRGGQPIKGRKNQKKPTPAKQSSVSKADQAYLDARKVSHPTEEIKHIRAFVNLTKKTGGDKKGIVGAFERLAKAITSRKITKSSTLAGEIEYIQHLYVKTLNAGQSPYVVKPSDDKLARLLAIIGGEKVYKSVDIINKFIGWSEETKSEKQIRQLLAEIQNAKSKGKIKPADPYARRVDEIEHILQQAKDARTFNANDYDLSGLRGLAGELGCPCQQGVGGLGDIPPTVATVADSMTAEQMMSLSYPTYSLTGDWIKLLGEPQTNAKVMIWGEPGQGKSTLGYKLARYMASSLGKVLYLSSEEYPSLTMKKKIELVGGAVAGWEFTRDLAKLDRSHKFLFIDSVNDSGFTQEQLRELVKNRPDLFIVLIFQATKEGRFKGGKEWEHDVDVVITIEAGQASTTKNRFAPLSSINVFN